jgi:tetratricopeptide (TPR) repeat protein
MKRLQMLFPLLGFSLLAPMPLRAEEKPAGQVSEAKLERIREANKRKAREQMARDSKEYKREEFAALEELYQKANANPRTPESQEILRQVVERYPKSNRAGCAALYIGQFSKDAKESEQFLERAIKEYSDCYYLNGTSVGAFARLLLGMKEKQAGHDTKAGKLFDEIRKDYATATSHNGKLIVETLPQ